jgi:hypothetical protein
MWVDDRTAITNSAASPYETKYRQSNIHTNGADGLKIVHDIGKEIRYFSPKQIRDLFTHTESGLNTMKASKISGLYH